jgi:hypothetical protein
MDAEESAKNGSPVDSARFPSRSEIAVPERPTRREQLDYIADLAGELRAMAVQAGCQVLAELLEQASLEAARCRCRGR